MPLVTMVGGSGFLGRYAAQAFARAGWRVRVAVRRPNAAIALRTYGDVGQVEPVQANIRDDASIAAAMRGADLVVNLVGILAPLGKQSFDAVQADGAARVAKAAKAAGAARMIQISAIGADPDSRSAYARTKAEGEAAVLAEGPTPTILRPSIVFGEEDQFFNRFAGMARFAPALPVVGARTKFQPIFVADVAKAILAASQNAEAEGRTLELGGPSLYSFEELMGVMLETIRRRRGLIKLPFWLAKIQGRAFDLIPYASLGLLRNDVLTYDQVVMLQNDNVVDPGKDGMALLGLKPTSVEAVIPSYLYRFRPYGQFEPPPMNDRVEGA
ncbi:MAG: complex I NDUFA9 subunit family protein [Pseudomonadota bacterium]